MAVAGYLDSLGVINEHLAKLGSIYGWRGGEQRPSGICEPLASRDERNLQVARNWTEKSRARWTASGRIATQRGALDNLGGGILFVLCSLRILGAIVLCRRGGVDIICQRLDNLHNVEAKTS